jgi:hypothetical protein
MTTELKNIKNLELLADVVNDLKRKHLTSSSVGTKNVGNETDHSNGRPRKIPSTSTTASANQRR